MNRLDGGSAEPEHRVVFFSEHALARDQAAMGVRDAFAGEIDQNLKSPLFRFFLLRCGDHCELRLALLHGEHSQVGGSDDSQVNIAFRIKSDILRPKRMAKSADVAAE